MSKERVVAVVEARMGSTRLPGKSARPIADKPLVQRVIERIRRAETVDEVVLATSTSPKDDALEALGKAIGARVHRGSEDDVLGRILGAAHAAGATIHVQCWGDCPFADPNEVDRVVLALQKGGLDLVSNCLHKPRELPYGLDVLALRVSALERAERETREDARHREHGTTYIYENPALFKVELLPVPKELAFPDANLTINTQDDFDFIDALARALDARGLPGTFDEVRAVVAAEPKLANHPNARGLAPPGS